jgi:hypothetical protein
MHGLLLSDHAILAYAIVLLALAMALHVVRAGRR